ncbi:MAG: glycosyltransferase family 1 protein [Prolixibacteraceae bacterium]
MRIGFEAKRVFQNSSGLGNYSRNLIDLLAKYYPENSYLLFAPVMTVLYSMPNSVEAISPSSGFSKIIRPYWRMHKVSKLLKCNEIDIYHGLSNVLPFGIKESGIPSVLTVHDLIFLRYPNYYKKIDQYLYRYLTTNSCKNATKILAISHQTKYDIVNLLGINPEKIEVIHQSCNKYFYEKVEESRKEAIRLKFNLPKKFILCVGTIEQRKNQLAILKGVVQENLDIPVVLLGKPTEYKMQLEEFIAKFNIQKQLLFLHKTTFADLQAIYQMAEIMVYPSFYEGFGLPVLEAQASGCPVITSNISSLPEAGGDGAVYIDPASSLEIGRAIREILMDNDLKDELIQKGKANALLFNDQAVADKLMRMYQKLYDLGR